MVELKTDMKTSSTKKVKKSKPEKPDVPEVGMEVDENPKKVVKELKLDFETDYNLNQAKIADFVEALLKIHNGKQSKIDKTGEKKTQLFGAEETPVNLQISAIKVPKESRKHLVKIALPHVPLVDTKDICVFVKDLEKVKNVKKDKVDHEDSVNHFKDLISAQGVDVASVISLRELKVEYKNFEAKTALCHRHEIFLADMKILRFLPKFLGKPFYSRKKFPCPINLKSKDLKKEVNKALSTVFLPLGNQGSCSMLRIGNTSMKPNHLVDNILQATEILAKRYPGGWKNIRSIHLKTETSMSIPIHISNLSANDVGYVDTTAPQKAKKEPITDELSTVLDAKVTVTANFDVKVEGGKVPDEDMLFDDKEEAESEDEASETPAKKKFNSDEALKKRKMKEDQKTKNKKAKKDAEESEDEEDKEIEQAESEYLNRPDAGEGDNDEKENNEEEEASDDEEGDDEEEEASDEEEDELEEASEDEAPPVVAKPTKKAMKKGKQKT